MDITLPIWSVKNLTNFAENTYSEVKIFASKRNGDEENDGFSSTDSVLCHICNVHIPAAYFAVHETGNKHKTYLKITQEAIRRTQGHLLGSKTVIGNKNGYYCDPCATVFENDEKDLHNASKDHLDNVNKDALFNILASMYSDSHANNNAVEKHKMNETNVKNTVRTTDFLEEACNDIDDDMSILKSEEPRSTTVDGLNYKGMKYKIDGVTPNEINTIGNKMQDSGLSNEINNTKLETENLKSDNKIVVGNNHESNAKKKRTRNKKKKSNKVKEDPEENCIDIKDTLTYEMNKSTIKSPTEEYNEMTKNIALNKYDLKNTQHQNEASSPLVEDNFCKVCKVNLPRGQRNLEVHNQGQRHLKNITQCVEKQDKCDLDTVKMVKINLHSDFEYMDNSDRVKCRFCKIRYDYDVDKISEHLNSNGHNKIREFILEKNTIKLIDKKYYCNICKAKIKKTKVLDHIEKDSHVSLIIKSMEEDDVIFDDYLSFLNFSITKEYYMEVHERHYIYYNFSLVRCNICNDNEPINYTNYEIKCHIESTRHKEFHDVFLENHLFGYLIDSEEVINYSDCEIDDDDDYCKAIVDIGMELLHFYHCHSKKYVP